MRTVAWVRGIGKLTGPELYASAHAADRIGTSTSNLLTCIGFETRGTFSPSEPNAAGSGAVGEIQFMPKTMCALLGWSNTAENRAAASATFARMTYIEQLEYVVKYFAWFKGKSLAALEDLYCAVFWPAAIGKSDDYVIARRPPPELAKEEWTFEHKVYVQNAGFDKMGNRDGVVTKGEVCRSIRAYRATANGQPDIEIPEPEGGDTAPFSDAERLAVLALVSRTSDEATEEFRKDRPAWMESEDDEPPATEPNS